MWRHFVQNQHILNLSQIYISVYLSLTGFQRLLLCYFWYLRMFKQSLAPGGTARLHCWFYNMSAQSISHLDPLQSPQSDTSLL